MVNEIRYMRRLSTSVEMFSKVKPARLEVLLSCVGCCKVLTADYFNRGERNGQPNSAAAGMESKIFTVQSW